MQAKCWVTTWNDKLDLHQTFMNINQWLYTHFVV